MKTKLLATLVLGISVSTGAQASLFDRGNGLIYDDYSKITWTANANIAGLLSWADANVWAANLVLGGYSDWRLPATIPENLGYNQSGSEMGHLFYTDLGVTAGNSITSSTSSNYALFSNAQGRTYWTGTEYTLDPSQAWDFSTVDGNQDPSNKNKPEGHFAWAVRFGDIVAVPVPGAVWLFGSGLLGLLSFKRRGTIG